VQNPLVDDSGKASSGNINMTLDLTPADATNVIFASENANLWIALLPPQNPHGYPSEGTFGPSLTQLVGAS
jgi:hypothetical protein